MSIITQTNNISIPRDKFDMRFFEGIKSDCFDGRPVFRKILRGFINSVPKNTIKSPHKSCAQFLEAVGRSKKDTVWTECWSALVKLGFILKHDNRYHVNPLIADTSKSRRYEIAIDYYNLLFQDTAFNLLTIEALRELAVQEYIAKLDRRNEKIEDENYIAERTGIGEQRPLLTLKSFQEYYDIAFNTLKPRSLNIKDEAIYKSINERYRVISTKQVNNLVYEHALILEQQGLVSIDNTRYTYNRLSVQLQKQLISYNETSHFLDNIPPSDEELAQQLFGDTQEQFQLEDELEDNQESSTIPALARTQRTLPDLISTNEHFFNCLLHSDTDISPEELKTKLAPPKKNPNPSNPPKPLTPEEEHQFYLDHWKSLSREERYDYWLQNPIFSNKLHKELTGGIFRSTNPLKFNPEAYEANYQLWVSLKHYELNYSYILHDKKVHQEYLARYNRECTKSLV